MRKYLKIILLMFFVVFPIKTTAQRGCCSHHGGVAGCNSNGRQICNDGTLSPSCTCTPVVKTIYGCTDGDAKNYNQSATKDDGSCEYYVYGCTDSSAQNYDINAEKDDGSCEYESKLISEEPDIDLIEHNIDDTFEQAIVTKTEEESEENPSLGNFWIFCLGAGGLGTYLYKKKKVKK